MGIPSGGGGLMVLCLAACSSAAEPHYRTAEVAQRDLVATIESTGRLRARGRLDLAPPISGRVVEVAAQSGEAVEAGRLLVRIASERGARELARVEAERAAARGRVHRAEAQWSQAQQSAARVERLFAQGQRSAEIREAARAEKAIAEAALEVARAELEAATARLEAAREVSAAALLAPGPGVVLRVEAELGQRVQAGGPSLVVMSAPLATLDLVATVGESDVARIQSGGAVSFEVPAHPERRFSGRVRRVGLLGTEEQGIVVYRVDVEADNAEGLLLPGMSAAVWFEVGRAAGAIVVPEAALRYRPAGEEGDENRDQVYRLRNGELQAVPVERGASDGAWVEVQGELQTGERVVLGVENPAVGGEGGLSLGGRQ